MIARGNTACHLQINNAIFDAVAPDHFAHDHFKRLPLHRRVHLEFVKTAPEAVQMPLFIDHPVVEDRHHLIDPVGKLIAAILDMDTGGSVRDILTVYISNSGHLLPIS